MVTTADIAMRRHLVLILSFVAAVVCYALGLQSAATALIIAGMVFEAVFWLYLLTRRHRTPSK